MARFIKLTTNQPVWVNAAFIESFLHDDGVTAHGKDDGCRARLFLTSYGEDERLRVKESPEQILAMIAGAAQ